MKIYVSYYYAIRFFPTNLLPISTSISDPPYYHNGTRDKSIVFRDKRGVLNGVRCSFLFPGKECENLCHGPKGCGETPETCDFLNVYYKQLETINFKNFLCQLEELCKRAGAEDVALMVWEAPENKCSERIMLKKWFAANGYDLKEWGR